MTLPRTALTPTEQIVADIFVEILGVPTSAVARGTDFFDVGGNSFTVTQLAAQVHQLRGADKSSSLAEVINLVMKDMTVLGISLLIPAAASRQPPAAEAAPASPMGDVDWENEIF